MANQAIIENLDVDALKAHPLNPRIVMRESTVEEIAGQLKASGVFTERHAPSVRKVNGHYEIISGHHRVEAAKRAGIKKIPCWVTSLTDEQAFMELVLSNAQSELSPLEIGIHALEAVGKETGGRGRKGGLSAYAGQVGKNRQYLGELVAAATVFSETSKGAAQAAGFLDKAKHLAAIHKAHKSLWHLLVEFLLSKSWSVADTEHYVNKISDFSIPSQWEQIFLPLEDVVRHCLKTNEFSPVTVNKLIEVAERTEQIIATYSEMVDTESYTAAYRAWLTAGTGSYSWDVRQLVKKQHEIIAEIEATQAEQQWNQGDWRAHIGSLADSSISLLLTDPPYGMNFQSDYRLDRRKERKHDEIENDSPEKAISEIRAMLAAVFPKLAADSHLIIFTHWKIEERVRGCLEEAGYSVRGALVWVKNNTGMGDVNTTFAPQHERMIHAVKGSPILFSRPSDTLKEDRIASSEHPTEKPVNLLKQLIEPTTVEGQLVADPFGGVASTLVAAKVLKRGYWGCELDEDYYKSGLERLQKT